MRDTVNKFERDCTIIAYVRDDRIKCTCVIGENKILMPKERFAEIQKKRKIHNAVVVVRVEFQRERQCIRTTIHQ